MSTIPRVLLASLACVLGVGVALGWPEPGPDVMASAPTSDAAPSAGVVVVRRLTGPPTVATDLRGQDGQPIRVACSTCHSARTPNPRTTGADLDQFHVGLVVRHGPIGCLACHDPTDYDALRRADGVRVAYEDAIEVCGQCHGPQRRDYEHGSHGGMTGYWDLRRGGRERNACFHCHDPHAPAYGQVLPVFAPRDGRPEENHER